MREIKFRAWDKNKKEMREVLDIDFNDRDFVCEKFTVQALDKSDKFGNKIKLLASEIELFQFTGLKDKNDNEIYYNSSIVEFLEPHSDVGFIGYIHFDEENLITEVVKFNEPYSYYFYTVPNDCRKYIIGTIQENPELLEF